MSVTISKAQELAFIVRLARIKILDNQRVRAETWKRIKEIMYGTR